MAAHKAGAEGGAGGFGLAEQLRGMTDRGCRLRQLQYLSRTRDCGSGAVLGRVYDRLVAGSLLCCLILVQFRISCCRMLSLCPLPGVACGSAA